MKLSFFIQAGAPRNFESLSDDGDTLSEAIEAVFSSSNEYVVLVWNYIPLLLDYKYDISFMIDDVLMIIEEMKAKESGEIKNYWVSNTFPHIWTFKWGGPMLKIESEWGEIGNKTEHLLNESGPVTIEKEAFIAEWKAVFNILIKHVQEAGYDESKFTDMKRLVQIEQSIKSKGRLYT